MLGGAERKEVELSGEGEVNKSCREVRDMICPGGWLPGQEEQLVRQPVA